MTRRLTLVELGTEVRDAAKDLSASLRHTPEASWLMRLARRMVRLLLDAAGARR